MKEEMYGIMASLAIFSLVGLAMGGGIGSVSGETYYDGEANGFEWNAEDSSCSVETNGGDYDLVVDFNPSDEGGAYAAGGVGFEVYDAGGYEYIEDWEVMTEDKTEDYDDLTKSISYDIEKNEWQDYEDYAIGDHRERKDTFEYRIEQTTISYVTGDIYYMEEEGEYSTTFTYNDGPGPNS